jgi:preprotein translocase subunit SecE
MNRFRALLKEYSDELLLKVTWPRFDELQAHTVTVLVASLLIAIVIFAMDLLFQQTFSTLYQLVK